MKKFIAYFAVVSLIFFSLTGCKQKETTQEKIIRPVKAFLVQANSNALGKGYPAHTKAGKEVDISFRVGGAPLVQYNVIEGKKVGKGVLIGAIDPSNFKLAVESARARYNQAKAESDRYERLWKKGSVAKNDYERKYANYQQAKARLQEAENNLKYTKVYAPFNGYYGPKLVELGDVIKAFQPITKLYDLSKIEVVTTIPEQLAVLFKQFDKYEVFFDTYPGKTFSATLKNMEKTPTPEGFKLHLYLNDKNINRPGMPKITAGMSCRVNILLKKATGQNNEDIIVPTGAVFEGETDSTPSVWIITKNLTVKKQHVVLDGFAGKDFVRIKSGLKPGVRIVGAGSKRLVEGEKVTILNEKNFK